MTTSTESLGEMQWTDASARRGLVDLRELWGYRELIYVFALRDLQVRYRQTLVGVAWVVLQPLAQMAIFALFFGLLGRRPASENVPYPVVVLSGLVLWQVFAQGVQAATASLVNNRAMITKVYFPRIVLPVAAVGACTVDFLIGWTCLLVVALISGVHPSWWWTASPLAILAVGLAAIGVGAWTSALNALYRDVGYMIPFLIQVGFFVTPVVFESRVLVPPKWQPLLAMNPLAGAIELFRAAWLGQPIPAWWSLATSGICLVVVLVSGLMFFQRTERILVDRV